MQGVCHISTGFNSGCAGNLLCIPTEQTMKLTIQISFIIICFLVFYPCIPLPLIEVILIAVFAVCLPLENNIAISGVVISVAQQVDAIKQQV